MLKIKILRIAHIEDLAQRKLNLIFIPSNRSRYFGFTFYVLTYTSISKTKNTYKKLF